MTPERREKDDAIFIKGRWEITLETKSQRKEQEMGNYQRTWAVAFSAQLIGALRVLALISTILAVVATLKDKYL